MNLQAAALAGYRVAHPMSGCFPDEKTKNVWMAIAKSISCFTVEEEIDSESFIKQAEVLCESSYKGKIDDQIIALARLYQQMHLDLTPEAIYMYARAAYGVRGSLDYKDNFADDIIKLLDLPEEIVKKIESLPKINSKGKVAWYAGGYPTFRLLYETKHRCEQDKAASKYNKSYSCSMCRANVPHFMCG